MDRIHAFADNWKSDGKISEAYRETRVKLTCENENAQVAVIPIVVSEYLGSTTLMRFHSSVVSSLVWKAGEPFDPGYGAGETIDQSINDLVVKIRGSIVPGLNLFNPDVNAARI